MVIGLLQVDMLFPHTTSLKDKRSLLNRLKNHLRKQFNISIAELRYHNEYGRTLLGVTIINNESQIINKVLNQVEKYIETQADMQILNRKVELI